MRGALRAGRALEGGDTQQVGGDSLGVGGDSPAGGRSIPGRPRGGHRWRVGRGGGRTGRVCPGNGRVRGQGGTIGGHGHRGRGNAAGGREHPARGAQEAGWRCGATHVGRRVTGGWGIRTVAEARARSRRNFFRGPSGVLPGWLSGPGRPNLSSGLRIVESVGVACGRGRSAGFVSTHRGLGSTTRRPTGVVEDTRGLWRPLAPGWALEGKGRGKGRKVLARR